MATKEKYYNELNLKQREKIRNAIKDSIKKREHEIRVFESALITPIRNLIIIGKRVLKNEVPVSYYTSSSSTLSSYIKEFLSRGKK